MGAHRARGPQRRAHPGRSRRPAPIAESAAAAQPPPSGVLRDPGSAPADPESCADSRGDRIRTCDLRFWRPSGIRRLQGFLRLCASLCASPLKNVSRSDAASANDPGSRCPYRSSVVVIDAWPRNLVSAFQVDAGSDHRGRRGVASFVQPDPIQPGLLPGTFGAVDRGVVAERLPLLAEHERVRLDDVEADPGRGARRGAPRRSGQRLRPARDFGATNSRVAIFATLDAEMAGAEVDVLPAQRQPATPVDLEAE